MRILVAFLIASPVLAQNPPPAPPQPLPPVTVKAEKPAEFAHTTKYDDFFRRRKIGTGTFRTHDDLIRMGASDVVGGLQNIPGVSVSLTSHVHGAPEVRFRMPRCSRQPPNIDVYLNGAKVPLFRKYSENNGSELSSLTRRRDTMTSTCEDCIKLAEFLTTLTIADILFMEFYRGAGQIPSDLDRGDACAALVIWTR
jgi:hypothetical protein